MDFGEVCTDCLIGAAMLRTDAVTDGLANEKGPTSHAGKLENVEPMDSLEGLLVPLYHGPSAECKEEFHTVRDKKNRSVETVSPNVIPFQMGEQGKNGRALDRSIDDLVDAMRELVLVEKLTGRAGLPQRVYLAFSGVLMYAIKFAGCENEK